MPGMKVWVAVTGMKVSGVGARYEGCGGLGPGMKVGVVNSLKKHLLKHDC